MKFPKGKGFDLSGGLTVTAILEGGFFLVGRVLGFIGDERKDCNEEKHYHEEKHHPAKHEVKCPPPKVEIENEVTVEDGAEFLLLQLTTAFTAPGLPTIPVGSVVAVNVEEVLFIAPGVG